MGQKRMFLYALILTFLVFNIGIFLGYMLEASRVDKINDMYINAEMELLDQRIQEVSFGLMDFDCTLLVNENIKFADKIFEEALLIDKYEQANRINSDIVFQHKRFDLLRTLFWMNSIKIKQKCNSNYHNLVYFYDYNDPSLDQKSKQRVFSNLLIEVKEKYGDEVMLIPLAGDNDLSSVNLLLDKYQIDVLPTLLIDESVKLTELSELDEVESYLN